MVTTENSQIAVDRRARISAKPAARRIIYGPNRKDNILQPLYNTNGFLFPYTPTIFDSATVNYEYYDPIHTNQPFAAFKSVAVKEIQVTGIFSTMNQQEALQNIANIHFLRVITKMYFGLGNDGSDDSKSGQDLRGTPPPILLFNAYGNALYNNIPVIVTSFNTEFPADVDYVPAILPEEVGGAIKKVFNNPGEFDIFKNPRGITNPLAGPEQIGTELIKKGNIIAWLPTRFVITVQMAVQNTPDRLRRQFNLNDFRTGRLIKKGGWI